MKAKNKLAIFDRAYDKAAKLEPGQKSNLAPLELKILMKAINSYREKQIDNRKQKR